MEKKQFQAESKRLLDLMINSIYTHKEIFLRELISNASDAIDKVYYKALTDENIEFNKNDYYIELKTNKEERKLIISDTGIGMTKEELEENLGTIAKSGSFDFKNKNELKDGYDIIGQFGVGFYSAFMVADKITVVSRALNSEKAYKWESTGEEGYTIEEVEKDSVGTEITLKIKENTDDVDYDQYLEEYRIRDIVEKYSNYIRYPIKMEVSKTRLKEDTEDEYEEYREVENINSMIPIWKQNKRDLKDEDYINFYQEKRFGFDKPIKSIHMNVDGLLRYDAVLYIPSKPSFDFYTKEYEKGLELYSSGVMIMEKCGELLPDYFSFVKGVVDSEDLSLNISREILQKDRQLQLIASNIENKIKDELNKMMKEDREKYEEFFESFGVQIKSGIYENFGMEKDKLQDLLIFYSSREDSYVSLSEYIDNMKEEQKYIYYVSGDSLDRVKKVPQVEYLKNKGYEILYLLDPIDEFVIKMMNSYKEKEFRVITSDDLGIDLEEDKKEIEDSLKENKDLFTAMKDMLKDKVKEVRPSNRLNDQAAAIVSDGEISIEMEKLFRAMPDGQNVRADKILEVNINHDIFEKLKQADKEDLNLYTDLLYNQALLIEGLEVEEPLKFANNIWKLL